MHLPLLPTFSDAQESLLRYHQGNNVFNISSLKEFYRPVDSKGFAIKYVVSGLERYIIDNTAYTIGNGNYLLMSGEKNARVEIESPANVKGICVSIAPDVVSSTVASLCCADTAFPDEAFSAFFESNHFLENHYNALTTTLGSQIMQMGSSIVQGNFLEQYINEELFFNLSLHVVNDQVPVYKQLQNVRAVKAITRHDLYRRVIKGRDFIDSKFTEILSIPAIAREATMSDFHFFRLFKNVFGITPHQYILQKRLSKAAELLQQGKSVSATALDCGFSDVFSFSKSFKKRFGYSPSECHIK